MSTPISTEMLERGSAMEKLRPAWLELLVCQPHATMFMTPAWLETWWEVFGEARRLQMIACWDKDRLVGLAPLLSRSIQRRSLVTHTRMEFVGTGEDEAEEVGTEYPDALVLPGHERVVANAVAAAIDKAAPDEVLIPNLLTTSFTVRHLWPALEQRGFHAMCAPSGQRYRIELPATFDAYLKRLSKKKAKRVSYYRRRLEREGNFVQERVESDEQIAGALAELERLHTMRWNKQGKEGAFAQPKFRRFHQVIARRALAASELDLRVWRLEGNPVAAHYHFHIGDTVFYYQSGFDTEALGNMSGGLVTLTTCIEDAITRGFRYFDFMRAGDGTYKEEYGCETSPMVDLALYHPSLKGKTAFFKRHATRLLTDIRRQIRGPIDVDDATEESPVPSTVAPSKRDGG